jgi:hypothetical protein
MSSSIEGAEGEGAGGGIPLWARTAGGVFLRVVALFGLVIGAFVVTALVYTKAGGDSGFIGEGILGAGILGGFVVSLGWLIAMIVLAVRARRRDDQRAMWTNLLSIGVAAAVFVILLLVGFLG